MRVKFIVNPSAGRGRAGRALPALEKQALAALGSFDALVTTRGSELGAAAREALEAGYDRIVAVGGDGTLNGIANGFFEGGEPLKTGAALVPSPLGTGSDYFRTVSGGRKADWLGLLRASVVRPVDVGVIEWIGSGRRHFFLNVSTVGMGAEVVRRRERLPKAVPSVLAYALPTLTTLLGFRPIRAAVKYEGGEYAGGFLTLFVAKGTYAGGGMKLGGRVALDDGRLDVTIVKGMPLTQTLPRLPKLYTGKFEGDSGFVQAKTPWIEISAEPSLPSEADGEFLGTGPVRITVRPRALNICFPE